MVDERGRGGNLDPDVEFVVYQRLMCAIWEKAIEDIAMLDALNIDEKVDFGQPVYRSEIEAFARSKWANWIVAHLYGIEIDEFGAKERGIRRGERYGAALSGTRYKDMLLPYKDEKHTAKEWAEKYGVAESTILNRWSHRHGFINPRWLDGLDAWQRLNRKRYEYNGEMLTYTAIAKAAKLTPGEVQRRLLHGMTAEEAVKAARELRAKQGLPLEADVRTKKEKERKYKNDSST